MCTRSISANIPACTYCRPQVASVGLTEKAARDAGYEVKKSAISRLSAWQGDRARRA